MRVVGVSFGDNHAGQRNGLIRPGTALSWGVGSEAEEREIGDDVLSDWSKWLWYDVWLPAVETVLAYAGDDPIVLSHSGDAVHGDRFAGKGAEYFYSIHNNHQEQIAKETLRPWQGANIAAFLLAYGTGGHEFKSNSAAQNITQSVASWGWRVISDDHIDFDVDGLRMNLSHHGPSVSKIPRLRSGGAQRYVIERMQDALAWDDRFPELYQRGHVHMPVSTPVIFKHGPKELRSHIIVTPPLTGPNGYARQATRSMERVECGLYYWSAEGGKLVEVHPFIMAKSTRKFYRMTDSSGNVCYSHMIEEGGHKKHKKKKKRKKKKK